MYPVQPEMRDEPDTYPPADLWAHLAAFARNCVLHGDMTPSAERMLLGILKRHTA